MIISNLLKQLQQQQKDSYQKGYLDGIFSSQRIHSYIPYSREDENVFFSSAIVLTLQEYRNQFSEKDCKILDDIIEKTIKCYPSFKNFRGGKTYNFFKTTPMDFFPNGNIMKRFNFFKLADDADDTAYVYLTNNKHDPKWLKQKLIKHANGTLKWNVFLPKEYKQLKAYAVYFGKNMHIEIDVCVLSNILLWNFKNKLPLKKQDRDSIDFIINAVSSKDYIKHPYMISPCYPTSAQICYHLSRLIKQTKKHSLLQNLKDLLIDDIKLLLQKETLFINQLFFHISLLNLDTKPKTRLNYNVDGVLKNTDYFYTSIPLMLPKLWIRKLQKHTIFNFFGLRTKCNGYTTALLLEYEILLHQKK